MTLIARLFALALVVTAVPATCQTLNAQEPGWSPYVIARGQQRQIIRNTPIQYRPYRPLHFYGNTVRRIYHRGSAWPRPRSSSRFVTRRR